MTGTTRRPCLALRIGSVGGIGIGIGIEAGVGSGGRAMGTAEGAGAGSGMAAGIDGGDDCFWLVGLDRLDERALSKRIG